MTTREQAVNEAATEARALLAMADGGQSVAVLQRNAELAGLEVPNPTAGALSSALTDYAQSRIDSIGANLAHDLGIAWTEAMDLLRDAVK